jgi:hypothetical protein
VCAVARSMRSARQWTAKARRNRGIPAQDRTLADATRVSLSSASSTSHVVAAADKSRDAAKKGRAGCRLVKLDVLGSQALNHHLHDLGDDVTDFVVL